MALNRRPSLLAGYHNHFSSPERFVRNEFIIQHQFNYFFFYRTPLASYYPSLGPMSMGPHVDEQSKRSRYLTGGNLSVNSQLLPLSIEVKKVCIYSYRKLFDWIDFQEQQVYQPQTEAISPTPDDPKNDSNIRDSTIIRNAISKLESEIDITMKKLHRAKLSQVRNLIELMKMIYFLFVCRVKSKVKLIDLLLMKKKMMIETIYFELMVLKHSLKKFFMIIE